MRISVIGTGYVGLVTGACLAHLGNDVTCVDVNRKRIEAVNRGRPPFHEPGLPELLASGLATGRLRATTDLISAVAHAEMTILAVGTPCRNEDIDLSFLTAATEGVAEGLRRNKDDHVVVVKSTVVPGTTENVVGAKLKKLAKRTFGLCMNPEFLREGSAVADFLEPDRIVIGQADERSGRTLAGIYKTFDCPKLFTTLSNAEMIKYASNSLLATLISFSNELAAVCEATPGTDVDQIIDGVHLDRRLTPVVEGRPVSPGILSYLRAGCGFGGSCLPKDLKALSMFSLHRGVRPQLLEAVLNVNRARQSRILDLVEAAAGNLAEATIAVLGIAFKAGTDDLRDSPGLGIIDLLRAKRAAVQAYDPLVSTLPERPDVLIARSVEDALASADAAIISSALPELRDLDWNVLTAAMRRPVLIDGRNALRNAKLPAALKYIPIGRHISKEEFDEPRIPVIAGRFR